MKLRWPGFVRMAYWRWRAASLDARPWVSLADELPRDARIAIVGNAGYLADTDWGDEIDRCDLVVRMNNFQLDGFERSIGHRTDVFLTNFSRYTMSFDNPHARAARLVVSSRPMNFRRHPELGVMDRLGEHVVRGMAALGAQRVYVPSLPYFAEQVSQLGNYPTTGMMALRLVLDFLARPGTRLFLTGFSFFEGRSHYFSSSVVAAAQWHNLRGERRAFREAILANASWIHVDSIMRDHMENEGADEHESFALENSGRGA